MNKLLLMVTLCLFTGCPGQRAPIAVDWPHGISIVDTTLTSEESAFLHSVTDSILQFVAADPSLFQRVTSSDSMSLKVSYVPKNWSHIMGFAYARVARNDWTVLELGRSHYIWVIDTTITNFMASRLYTITDSVVAYDSLAYYRTLFDDDGYYLVIYSPLPRGTRDGARCVTVRKENLEVISSECSNPK